MILYFNVIKYFEQTLYYTHTHTHAIITYPMAFPAAQHLEESGMVVVLLASTYLLSALKSAQI